MADNEFPPPNLISGGGTKPKKRGGKRPGAGRPLGARNALALGEVSAVKAAKLRIPEGIPEEHAELAEEAKDHIVAVMRGQVDFKQAPHVLKAATTIRNEVCGPIAQKVDLDATVSVAIDIIRTVKP